MAGCIVTPLVVLPSLREGLSVIELIFGLCIDLDVYVSIYACIMAFELENFITASHSSTCMFIYWTDFVIWVYMDELQLKYVFRESFDEMIYLFKQSYGQKCVVYNCKVYVLGILNYLSEQKSK